jgi:hypothetical protein
MSIDNDRIITAEQRAEISKRKLEVSVQKMAMQKETLSDFKKELGIPEHRIKK